MKSLTGIDAWDLLVIFSGWYFIMKLFQAFLRFNSPCRFPFLVYQQPSTLTFQYLSGLGLYYWTKRTCDRFDKLMKSLLSGFMKVKTDSWSLLHLCNFNRPYRSHLSQNLNISQTIFSLSSSDSHRYLKSIFYLNFFPTFSCGKTFLNL